MKQTLALTLLLINLSFSLPMTSQISATYYLNLSTFKFLSSLEFSSCTDCAILFRISAPSYVSPIHSLTIPLSPAPMSD